MPYICSVKLILTLLCIEITTASDGSSYRVPKSMTAVLKFVYSSFTYTKCTLTGVNFEHKPSRRVKTMSNSGYGGVCLNTTKQEVFWRRPNGSVVSVNSFLEVNNSNDVFICEAPFTGYEPTYVYKETVAFVQDGASTDTDKPGT